MDISKIKPKSLPSGKFQVELDADMVERFKLFCLVDYYIGKSGLNWEVEKIQSAPSGQVVLYCRLVQLTSNPKG